MACDQSSYRMTMLLATIFIHLLGVSITLLVLYWLLNLREGFAFTSDVKFKIFNLHPLLMILGFIIFSGEGKKYIIT
ncbi:putative ascorbate ferrireductase (transmembrane) [Helianthus annuus]|nr:putative ascorbate ferrireductase (transmembrane) [Helianthus annuus]KAJ0634054.1 putative ascorbate ferrireductase (transmembrane) [Helianthus annuus]